jgi:hypothetical protein
MLTIYRKLTDAEVKDAAKKVEAWFKAHPRRKVCRTDIYGGVAVRRGHVSEDITGPLTHVG